jgi:isopenicillin N synthase-like dioxygenase
VSLLRYVQHNLAAAQGRELNEQQQQQLDFAAQLSTSCCHKARLLHYFPFDSQQQQQQQQQAGASDEDWCGWHLDHGALTGALVWPAEGDAFKHTNANIPHAGCVMILGSCFTLKRTSSC